MGFANSINYAQEVLFVTSGVTFGYTPGLQTPVRELVVSAAAGTTVQLPPVQPVYPTPPGTPGYTSGSGDGLQITVRNATTNAITIAITSPDTLFDGTTMTGTAGAVESFICSTYQGGWYKLAN